MQKTASQCRAVPLPLVQVVNIHLPEQKEVIDYYWFFWNYLFALSQIEMAQKLLNSDLAELISKMKLAQQYVMTR